MDILSNFRNKTFNNICENIIKEIPDNSIDTIITDPPYAIKFKNNKWDYKLPNVDILKQFLRVIKPGGTLLIFGGTRTYHRLAVNLEDAGWYISNMICWLYCQGFPKSVDISYMIDKKINKSFGEEYQNFIVGNPMDSKNKKKKEIKITKPKNELSKKWFGWGYCSKTCMGTHYCCK